MFLSSGSILYHDPPLYPKSITPNTLYLISFRRFSYHFPSNFSHFFNPLSPYQINQSLHSNHLIISFFQHSILFIKSLSIHPLIQNAKSFFPFYTLSKHVLAIAIIIIITTTIMLIVITITLIIAVIIIIILPHPASSFMPTIFIFHALN